jgi:diguanylate cyclase (GGDEF)-like protein
MRLFAACMTFFAAVTVNCGLMAALYGSSIELLQSNAVASATLLTGLVSSFVVGLFLLYLSSSELIARSADESQKDPLSGAFNRRGIEAKLAAELKHVQRSKSRLSVALIDVDYFKSINDIQGHAAGDAALRDVAEAISTHLRGRDYLGRYGGDEFLLILPQTPVGIAAGVTERLNQAIGSLSLFGRSIPLTLSIGLTEAVPEDDAVTLIARADKALYQAKSAGRNCRRVVTAGPGDPEPSEMLQNTTLGALMIPPVGSSVMQ